MEVLNLIRLFWGWGFPYINLTYRLYRWGFLHFMYLKCLVNKGNILKVAGRGTCSWNLSFMFCLHWIFVCNFIDMKTYIVHMQHVDIICLQTTTTTTTTTKIKTRLFGPPEQNVLSSQCDVFFLNLSKKNNEKKGPIPPKTKKWTKTFAPKTKEWTRHIRPQNKCAPQTFRLSFPHSHRPVESMEVPLSPWSIAWHGSAASKNCAKVVAGPRWPEARMFQPQMGGWKLIPGLGYMDNNPWWSVSCCPLSCRVFPGESFQMAYYKWLTVNKWVVKKTTY